MSKYLSLSLLLNYFIDGAKFADENFKIKHTKEGEYYFKYDFNFFSEGVACGISCYMDTVETLFIIVYSRVC